MPNLTRNPVTPSLLFKGRPEDPRVGEWVRAIDSTDAIIREKREAIVIYGCPDDKGVLINRGRAGAKEGPDAIRKHFYKMALPMDLEWEKRITLYDLGNLIPSDDILETHRRASAFAESIAGAGATVIALGGGHDFGAPNFLGFAQGSKSNRKLGLINVDPHLDVRPLENDRPHSGTPFRQILESKRLARGQFVEFGARASRNARSHFAYAKKNGVKILTLESILRKAPTPARQFASELTALSKKSSQCGVTFDMDACADGEGVSAAPVIGFSAWQMHEMAYAAGKNRKVKFLEFAEVAPPLDPVERTSRIAAELIYAFLRGRAE